MTPTRSLLDPAFVYVPADRTDVRETFRRERERLQDEARARRAAEHRREQERQREEA